MRHFFIFVFMLLCACSAFARENQPVADVNTIFEIHLDSVERKVTVNKWGTDSSYFLHYTVKNISGDTLTYVTNSCFYYHHCTLTIGQMTFDLNPTGGCMVNALSRHTLAPGESFHRTEWITAKDLEKLTAGEYPAKLRVPLVKDDKTTYRVDGRTFVENEVYLISDSDTKVMETYIDTRRRKKNGT